jgi:coenzyme Q-binding protein COQ10
MHHHNSKRLPYTCKQLFDLVADIESYPAFLPGWSRVHILHSDDARLDVEQQLRIGPFPLRFRSTAQLEDCDRILITSHNAPFGHMTIDWHFRPLQENHCEVSIEIALDLYAGPFRRPLSRMLEFSGDELLLLFEQRARSLYPVT